MSNPSLFNKVLGSLVGFAIGDAAANAGRHTRPSSQQGEITQAVQQISAGANPADLHKTSDVTEVMMYIADAYIVSYFSQMSYSTAQDYETLCCRELEFWYTNNSASESLDEVSKKVIASAFGKDKEEWLRISAEVNRNEVLADRASSGALLRCLFPALVNNETAAISQGLLTHTNNESSRCIILYTELLKRYLSSTLTVSYRSSGHMEPTTRSMNAFNNAAYWAAEKSFKSAILGAVNDGGDSRTISALTGALAGARYGYNQIPEEMTNMLDQELYTKLRTIAERATEILIQE